MSKILIYLCVTTVLLYVSYILGVAFVHTLCDCLQ